MRVVPFSVIKWSPFRSSNLSDHDQGGSLFDHQVVPFSVDKYTRIRHQLDRDSALYQAVYRQRTACERINSQALDLGIERPRLRNQQAIAHLNTLTYVLIDLRARHRLVEQRADNQQAA